MNDNAVIYNTYGYSMTTSLFQKNFFYTSKSNLLIVGGIGYIGSNMINSIYTLFPSINFFVLDNLSAGYTINTINPSIFNNAYPSGRFLFIKGDMGDSTLVNNILSSYNIDTIIHLAVLYNYVPYTSTQFIDNNVKNLDIFLSTCKPYCESGQIKHIMYHSSIMAYLQSQNILNATTLYIQPVTPSIYQITKTQGLSLSDYYQQNFDMPITQILSTHVFGGNNQHQEDIVLLYANTLYKSKKIVIYEGDNINKDNWIHIVDVINAYITIINSGYINHRWYNLFNSSQHYTNLQVAHMMIKQIRNTINYEEWLEYSSQYTKLQHININTLESTNLIGWNANETLQSEINTFLPVEQFIKLNKLTFIK